MSFPHKQTSGYPALSSLFISGLLLLSTGCRAQTYLGNYTSYSTSGKAVTVTAGNSALRFIYYKPNLVRVDYLPTLTTTFDSSLVVVQDTTLPVSYSVTETDSSLTLTTSSLRIVCSKYPVRVSFYSAGGELLVAEPTAGGISSNQPQRTANFSILPDEHFYGTGERGMSLDLRGKAFDSYNTQEGGYGSPAPDVMNVNVPFVLSSKNYGIYFENTYPGHFDIGRTSTNSLSYSVSGGELSYFFTCDSDMRGVLTDYTWLTGTAPLIPKWAFGYIQSKYGYRNAADASTMVQRMRDDTIPCDAIVLDLYWFQHMGDLTWNTSLWPTPKQMTADFLSKGFKTVVITEPYIVQPSLSYSTANQHGYLAKNAQGQTYVLSNWWSCGCDAGLLDITNPAAQSWWWNKYNDPYGNTIFPEGVSGVWTDLGEPERDYTDMQFYSGPDTKVHNVYNFLWAETLFKGFNNAYPDQRLFNLTRAGYAGIQRFNSVTWSGDGSRTFGGLAVQLPFLLNMGLSGIAYHNSDIGGFSHGTTTAELYTRWMEFGVFCPVMRAHGHDGSNNTEPWAFGAATENIIRKMIQLRYALLPYNYTLAHDAYISGIPLARPLVLAYPGDSNVSDESSAYMWGDNFIVAPVVASGQTVQSFYLPQGKWVNYWTDQVLTGGTTVSVPAPIDQVPLLVRAGSIIPMQPVVNYVDEYPADTLRLAIYPSAILAAHYTLYEDDGKTLQYQRGAFATTDFEATTAANGTSAAMQFSVGPSVGSYNGKRSHRTYICEVHAITSRPPYVQLQGSDLTLVSSRDSLRFLTAGWFYSNATHVLYVKFLANTDSSYVITSDSLQLTGAQESSEAPSGYELYQNFPNPFNPTTTIKFFLATRQRVSLKVYDSLGRQIAALLNEDLGSGFHTATFSGKSLPSGAYFYNLKAGSFSETKTMVLVK